MLRHAAPLHDVGKVVVRAEVLAKPGPLTPEERAEMRAHPRRARRSSCRCRTRATSCRTCCSTTSAGTAAAIPCGLGGESIPVEARLLAVADAFDAMTSARPYRPTSPREDAFAELEREAGKQFDPFIVETFLAVWQGAAFAAA